MRLLSIIGLALLGLAGPVLSQPAVRADVLPMTRVTGLDAVVDGEVPDNRVRQHSLAQPRAKRDLLKLERSKPWSLPSQALADFYDTIQIAVFRFDFQYEETDDPNTTGRGTMNMGIIGPDDWDTYVDTAGHGVDPPPHNALYFHAHMKALRRYYETVSEGKITLDWTVFPGNFTAAYLESTYFGDSFDSTAFHTDSANLFRTYQLAQPMSYYGGDPTGIIPGLEKYFEEGIALVDNTDQSVDFGRYDSYFMFHAGADRQNDIGFPTTSSDLFTGYISYYDTIWVDDHTTPVTDAMLMPEYASQDNRGTALNAVLAHEFGHQLGLVDLYRTDNFVSCLGDFALMDHNGFGTAIDFQQGWSAGRTFGVMPIYPSAWSRAYLGFVEVHDFRQGTDIEVAAAEIAREGIKIARVPISENEYYLIENRLIKTGAAEPLMKADRLTSVFQGPYDTLTGFTSDYDFLIPGSGMLIFHVDEAVAYMNNNAYTGDTVNNFNDNRLQWVVGDPNPSRKFVTLIEADGIVDLSGYYQTYGEFRYGNQEDMFRDDRNRNFTPNTNPAAVDHSYNNSHVRITGITRPLTNLGGIPRRNDSLITFDLETDGQIDGFPVRGGVPRYALSPIVEDLNGDGVLEIIFASGPYVNVVTPTGQSFLHQISGCDPCTTYYDMAAATVHPGRYHPLPLYYTVRGTISANPVTGDFGLEGTSQMLAVGFSYGDSGEVNVVEPADVNNDGLADRATAEFATIGSPIAMAFGDNLYVLTDSGRVYYKGLRGIRPTVIAQLGDEEFFGLVRLGNGIIVVGGDSAVADEPGLTQLNYIEDSTTALQYTLNGHFSLGPIAVDVDRSGPVEIILFSPDGDGVVVSFDHTAAIPFTLVNEKATGYEFTANPVAGDLDNDGYPEILVGGVNALYVFDRELTIKPDYPQTISSRYTTDPVLVAPIIADIEHGDRPETIFPTLNGNIWSLGENVSFGFPLSGGELGMGSPVFFNDSTGGGNLGYLGLDGWFYLWRVDDDHEHNYWPMYGADPSGSFVFDATKLGSIQDYSEAFAQEKFFNYPNPVQNGMTRIRYFLGQDASRVNLTIYDLAGQVEERLTGPTSGGLNHDVEWSCSGVVPGVYRCMIEIDFGGRTETAFTDIAVIR
ncbi:MAG: hypothetical protein ABIE70_08845 [bacterium]